MTIVVGVDGSENGAAALRWSIEESRLRGTTLLAVHAWEMPYLPGARDPAVAWPDYDASFLDPARFEELAQAQLEAALAPARAAGSTPETRLVEGNAAQALIEASRAAELLVVGSRGHRGLSGLLLGSVSHACLQHATCPIAVIRAGEQPATPQQEAAAAAVPAPGATATADEQPPPPNP